jgi:hypothetical protein
MKKIRHGVIGLGWFRGAAKPRGFHMLSCSLCTRNPGALSGRENRRATPVHGLRQDAGGSGWRSVSVVTM